MRLRLPGGGPGGSARSGARAAVRVAAIAALWAAAIAALEALLLERQYHIGVRHAVHLPELMLNYAVYAVAGALPLWLAARLLLRRSGRAVRPVESFVGAAMLTRVPRRARLAVRSLLAIWVAGNLLWPVIGGARDHRPRPRPGPGATPPSVVLIIIDTLRADFVSSYGYPIATTPGLDRLARDGVRFERAIAQSSWTTPSTATLLTGLYPSSHGATGIETAITDAAPSLATCLREAGYRTAAFSENWLVAPRFGFGRGFDSFHLYWSPWIHAHTVLHRLAARVGLPTIDLSGKEGHVENPTDPSQLHWDARVTADRVLDWLDDAGEDADRPFFLYVHFMGPHGPYGPPEFLLDVERPLTPLIDHPREMGGGFPLGVPGAPVTGDHRREMLTLYAADIRYVDRAIGRILDRLEEPGRRDGTLVIVGSDHGEEFYEHEGWNHGGSAFEEIVRVPLVVAGAGITAGRVVGDVVRLVDVMPTILDIAGVEPPGPLHGRSLAPFLAGMASPPPRQAYVEAYPRRPPGCAIEAITGERWKLIRVRLGDRSRFLLHDLATDPTELADVAAEHPTLRDSLLREMARFNRAAHLLDPRSRTVTLDRESIEALRGLGYIE